MKVYDEMGKQVADIENSMGGSNLVKVDLKPFAAGIYIAVVERDNVVIRKKLLRTE